MYWRLYIYIRVCVCLYLCIVEVHSQMPPRNTRHVHCCFALALYEPLQMPVSEELLV